MPLLSRESALLVLLTLSYLVSVSLLIGIPSISSSSEAREAEVVRTILTENEYILPRRYGYVPSKPPLYHWVAASVSSSLGKVTEFSIRFTSVLHGMGILILAAILGWGCGLKCFPNQRQRALGLAALSGLILGTTYGFHRMLFSGQVDMAFAFWVTLALTVAFLTIAQGDNREINWIVFYGACGLATLAKGPLGLILPLFVLFSWLACCEGLAFTVRTLLRPRAGWLLFVLLSGLWYTAATVKGGERFLDRVFFENLGRALGVAKITAREPWYYISSGLRATLPWSAIALALVYHCRERLQRSWRLSKSDRLAVFGGLIWFLSGIAFLSLSSGKRTSYLLPLYPGFALFCSWLAVTTYHYFSDRELLIFREWGYRLRTILISALIFSLFLLHFSSLKVPFGHPEVDGFLYWLQPHAIWVAASVLVLLATSAGSTALLRPYSGCLPWMQSGIAFIALMHVTTAVALGYKAEKVGFKFAADQIAALVGSSDLVVAKRPEQEVFDPVLFYLDRKVRVTGLKEGLGQCREFLLLREEDLYEQPQLFTAPDKAVTVVERFNAAHRERLGKYDRAMLLLHCNES